MILDKIIRSINDGLYTVITLNELLLSDVILLNSGYLFFNREKFSPLNSIEVKRKAEGILKGTSVSIHFISPSDMRLVNDAIDKKKGGDIVPDAASDIQETVVGFLRHAADINASDMHIRVSTETDIYFRVHGDLIHFRSLSRDYGHALCRALYATMCDVSESDFTPNEPQDARMSGIFMPDKLTGARVATAPQADGFLMVLRLLYKTVNNKPFSLSQLGYIEKQEKQFHHLESLSNGMVIIAGSTGSGKSTTLQSVLSSCIVNSNGTKNIITVEDPPEYIIHGAVQIPVKNAVTEEKRRAAFSSTIKAMMRLDPDICMIGEVRDSSSADLALQAAMTGHAVWTTVHANSALGILSRLQVLGLSRSVFADEKILTGLVYQTLVKKLCRHCKHPFKDIEKSDVDISYINFLNKLDSLFLQNGLYIKGDGCIHCDNKGVIGRTVVAETIVCDENFMKLFASNKAEELNDYIETEADVVLLRDAVLDKILAGDIDPFDALDSVGPFHLGVSFDRLIDGYLKRVKGVS